MIDIETIHTYCTAKAHTIDMTPFDDITIVYKVGSGDDRKIFALISTDRPDYLLVKCDPDLAVELRERYSQDIEPGFHMNKRHWNGINLCGSMLDRQVFEMIDHSYDLVYKSLPKRVKADLEGLG